MGPVLAVVLAAGGSTRMGRPKQLAELGGRPLLAHALAALDEAPVDRVVVALGGAAGEVLDRVELGRAEPLVVEGWAAGMGHVLAALDEAPVDRVVVALGGAAGEVLDRVELGRAEPLVVEGWAAGMGHVLAATLARAGDGWSAVVVLLGDQPLVPGRAVARLVEAWGTGAGPVVTAIYGGRPGHPKLFDRRLLPDLLRLTGDTGARDLVAAHPEWVHRVEVGDLGSDTDVDVEADLDRVGAMLTSRRL
jgi:molybdenum cofactor cytidylyltransferase